MDNGKVATELLDLERQHLKGGLSTDESDRWNELIVQFIQMEQASGEQRRNLRYQAECAITLTRAGETCRCEILDLSFTGMRLKGDLSRTFRAGDVVTLTGLEVGGRSVPVEGTLELTWKRGRWRAGARFVDLSTEARRLFFRHAYYPAYLRHLVALARN